MVKCEQETNYIGELLTLKMLLVDAETQARIDSGTLPTVIVRHDISGSAVTGTPSFLTGGFDKEPTLKVVFTPDKSGRWVVAVKAGDPYNAEERFELRVEA